MLQVIQIPTLFDNYTYLIICTDTHKAVVIDCPDADPVIKEIQQRSIKLIAVLSTHHHADHTAGNEELKEYFKVPVYGSAYDRNRVLGLTDVFEKTFVLGNLSFDIIDIPGHTLGHVALYGYGSLFCGDTLFAAGCGRLFEGTPVQMFSSLAKLNSLPENTKVYCGHEYTKKNLEFAMTIDSENEALRQKYFFACEAEKKNESTVPTTLAEEKSYNPFLRAESLDVFTKIRKLKDTF